MSANNSKLQIFKFATMVCLVCSLVVSATAVALRTKQEQNALNEKRINILRAAALAKTGEKLKASEIDALFEKITPVVVNLKTGELDTAKDAASYDMYLAANTAGEGRALSEDPASIKRIANDGSAYLLIVNDQIERVILPIQGYGLWSTMYGFTALTLEDNVAISSITFYAHGETPGLGAEITNPKWQSKWVGLKPYTTSGQAHIVVAKNADVSKGNEVDAIAGATLTSRGVEHLVNFWLGEQGYQRFIENLVSGKIEVPELQQTKGV